MSNVRKRSRLTIAALAISLMASASANAMVEFNFAPGLPTPGSGFTVVDPFNDLTGITAGSNYEIHPPGSDSAGAQPANSVPCCTPYLSVLGGGSATIAFADLPGVAPPVEAFQFDWGSVDSYNSLTIDYTYNMTGSSTLLTGSAVAPPADGNQASADTNGRFTVWGTAGETFDSITLASGSNSFEIDNLAVGSVPEPATWALMLAGFGFLGFAASRPGRRTTTSIV
jgi:hypothetical protein